MPSTAQFASKAQMRMMYAIMKHPGAKQTQRGDYGPPQSIAQKYINNSRSMGKEGRKSLPEDKGQALHGGKWEKGGKTEKRAKMKHEKQTKHIKGKEEKHTKKITAAEERKKKSVPTKKQSVAKKAKAEKIGSKKYGKQFKKSMTELLAFDQHYMGQGSGVVIFNEEGKMLLGRDSKTGKWGFIGGHVENDETYADAALREAKEETGLDITNLEFLGQAILEGNISFIYTARAPKGIKPKGIDGEMSAFKFISKEELAHDSGSDKPMKMRSCTWEILDMLDCLYGKKELKKSEDEEEVFFSKSITDLSDLTYEVSPKMAYSYVGNGLYRCIWDQIVNLQDEEGQEIMLGYYKLQIRKHVGDMYSGRLFNGQKIVHTFIMRPFKDVIVELLGLFDWQMPDGVGELDISDPSVLSDDAISGAIRELMDSYRKNSLANIYTEIENIRNEIRQNSNLDIQQAEARLMKVIDKLNDEMKEIQEAHNVLVGTANEEIDDLRSRITTLQDQIDSILNQPSEVYAVVPGEGGGVEQPERIFNKGYYYLSKPDVASDNGKIKFLFKSDWTVYDQKSFLKDLRAKIINKKK